MRFIAGLAAAIMMTASLPAAAQVSSAASAYEVVPAPASSRGQVVEAGGVRTFTADNGWYTMTLGPADTTEIQNDIRFFTYGLETMENYVDVALSLDVIEDPADVISLDVIQANVGTLLTENPAFLEGINVTERKILTLGNGNGRKPIMLAVWIGTDPKAPGTVTVIGGTLLPRGSLMVMIDCNQAEDAEAVLRDHLRIAEGALE